MTHTKKTDELSRSWLWVCPDVGFKKDLKAAIIFKELKENIQRIRKYNVSKQIGIHNQQVEMILKKVNNQVKFLELINVITEMKSSLDELNIRLEFVEERLNERGRPRGSGG